MAIGEAGLILLLRHLLEFLEVLLCPLRAIPLVQLGGEGKQDAGKGWSGFIVSPLSWGA
jgi:hypothetical protein